MHCRKRCSDLVLVDDHARADYGNENTRCIIVINFHTYTHENEGTSAARGSDGCVSGAETAVRTCVDNNYYRFLILNIHYFLFVYFFFRISYAKKKSCEIASG